MVEATPNQGLKGRRSPKSRFMDIDQSKKFNSMLNQNQEYVQLKNVTQEVGDQKVFIYALKEEDKTLNFVAGKSYHNYTKKEEVKAEELAKEVEFL